MALCWILFLTLYITFSFVKSEANVSAKEAWSEPYTVLVVCKCSRLRICLILSLQKIVSHIVCCEKLIFYLKWNHQQICKESSQTQNTHLLYRELLPMWYFELQPDYVESTYTPRIARTFVLLSAHVKTAVYQGMVMQTRAVCKLVVILLLNFVFR